MLRISTLLRALGLAALCLLVFAVASAGPIEDQIAAALRGVDTRDLATGVLIDRVLPLSGIERFDGGSAAPTASTGLWRQLYDELRRASTRAERPATEAVFDRARARHDAIPIAMIFDRYQRLTPAARERLSAGGAVRGRESFESRTAFAAAALVEATYRGSEVRFALERESFFSNTGARLARVAIDFDDGLGPRVASFDAPVVARYLTTGTKTLRVAATTEDGETLHASFAFVVRALATPLPDDTLHITGTVPYLGGVASGDAYVYLAPGRTALLNPVVVIEGFDLDNSMNWDELYALLDQQGLIEQLRADGYDAVVLNFADATDYLQRNAFVVVELLQELRATLGPQTSVALAGASMGGLLSRYALAYLESQGIPHSVRTYISFDAPHQGANIPLGIQHWVRFFAGQSADAAFLQSRLDRPAARQMLVYHYVQPPGTTGEPDPLRAPFLADLAALGNWPTQPRMVAIANGSGAALGQGFAAGAQIIQYNYNIFIVIITGNVWAVPNVTSTKIFDGRIFVLGSDTRQSVTVSNTLPYDNAPGGSRATMAQMDTTAVPYGDIVALYPSHCFIPTTSALAYDSPDLFHNVLADANPASHTPFDVVHVPTANQPHVEITAENAAWLRSEIEQGVTGVGPGAVAGLELAPAPNPSSDRVQIGFALRHAGAVDLRIFGVEGRQVARLANGMWGPGAHQITWNGRDASGTPVASGVYFVHLAADGEVATRRIVRVR